VLLVATVWLPWAAHRLWSASILFWTWPVLLAVARVFLPITLAGRLLEEILRRMSGRPKEEPDEEEAFEDEIRAIVSEGQHDGLLEADAREMIEGVIELGDIDVADIMTPRSRMDVLQVDMEWNEALEFVVRSARTRIPVCGKSLDEIRGILYVKDLLPELAKDTEQRRPLGQLVRPATFVPRTKAVDDLLREFQRTHNHMAIVVDEYQAVAGLITIEDVLEEIVGEIVDEHDQEEQDDVRIIDRHKAEALATAHLDELNERLGIDLPESDEFDTIGGLVVDRLGRIPKSGETVDVGDVRIVVLAATPRRIERVRIEDQEAPQRETA
jgi:CBS domain containing-hemolysin-like protein